MEVALASLNFGNAERARLLSMAPSGPSLIGSLGLPPPTPPSPPLCPHWAFPCRCPWSTLGSFSPVEKSVLTALTHWAAQRVLAGAERKRSLQITGGSMVFLSAQDSHFGVVQDERVPPEIFIGGLFHLLYLAVKAHRCIPACPQVCSNFISWTHSERKDRGVSFDSRRFITTFLFLNEQLVLGIIYWWHTK